MFSEFSKCSCVCMCSQADYRYSEINDKMNAITLKLGDAKVSAEEGIGPNITCSSISTCLQSSSLVEQTESSFSS